MEVRWTVWALRVRALTSSVEVGGDETATVTLMMRALLGTQLLPKRAVYASGVVQPGFVRAALIRCAGGFICENYEIRCNSRCGQGMKS